MSERNVFFDFLIMSRTRGKNRSIEGGLSSKEQLHEQNNVKRKKKKYNENKVSQNSVMLSSESDDDNFVETLLGNDVSKQDNIGPPVVVDALDNLSLNIPKPLKEKKRVQARNNVSDDELTYTEWNKGKACIITTESLSPSHETCNREKEKDTSPPLKNNRTRRKNKKQMKNDVVESSTSPIAGPSRSKTNESCISTPEKSDTDDYPTASLDVEDGNGNEVEMQDRNIDLNFPVRFYCLRNKVVAVMSEKSRFCFTGKLVVKVIHGAVEAYGSVITAESGQVEIYSPRGYSNVSIKNSENRVNDQVVPNVEDAESNIWTSLISEGVDKTERHKLVDEIEQLTPATAIVFLSNLENGLTKFLEAFYQFRLFPKVTKEKMISNFWTDFRRAELMLQSNLYTSDQACNELIIDPRISEELREKMLDRWRSNKWSCTLIVGGKSVGKSTATRYLINKLLPVSKKVVLLDVDPGQTECTPYGCISCSLIEQPLMGPNFTHLKNPVFQLYLGEVNVCRCITRYIEGVKLLADKISNSPVLSRLPIVVNTMGFPQGIGWDLALTIIKFIRPSFVVQIMSGKPKNNYMAYFSKEVVNRRKLPWATQDTNVIDWSQISSDHELLVVRSYAEQKPDSGYETWNMEPYQKRELVMISYLSGIVQNARRLTSRCSGLSLSINNVVPYITSLKSLYISVLNTCVPSSHVLNVLNGSIVALCGIDEDDSCLTESQDSFSLQVLSRPPLCHCYGFGIVRGIDTVKEEIFLNTPLSESTMKYVNCLMGCMPVPMSLLPLNQQPNIPYISGNEILPMGREHRRGYFRMRYQREKDDA